jgi:aryl-alcohol dehydrogenase-like predicted oxidoreductase
MKRRILGGTGMSVSEFALGAMMFGALGNNDHDESVRMIHTALDAGINFIDTSDVYSQGESEEIVGKALEGRRDDVVLATKFGLPMGSDANQGGGSPRWIKRAVEEQLEDLLAGADVELSEDVLDRIDEIVPPGSEINPADNYLAAAPALGDKRLRRH